MKVLRISTSILCAIVLILFLLFYFQERKNTDSTYPVITIENNMIDVSLQPTDEELTQGIMAYDGKDGNITEKIVVESISRFTEPGVSTVTYAVCDSDKHVATAKRKIRYVDYISPRFYMNRALVFSTAEQVDIQSALGAIDSIDGDISNRVIAAVTDYTSNTTGVFSVSTQVSNSKGDTIYLTLPIYIEELSPSAPQIELSEYLVYLEQGENLDPNAYLSSALDENGENLRDTVWIESSLNSNTEGVYSIHYYASDSAGRQGHTVLTVIVGSDL